MHVKRIQPEQKKNINERQKTQENVNKIIDCKLNLQIEKHKKIEWL